MQAYHKKILVCHPDKGGDPAIFREVQKVFEVLKEISERHFDKRPTRFVSFAASGHSTASAKKDTWSHFEGEFYQSAAEESMPIYHVVSSKTFHKRPGPVPILNQKREFIANGVM
jgi:hypothetical protein